MDIHGFIERVLELPHAGSRRSLKIIGERRNSMGVLPRLLAIVLLQCGAVAHAGASFTTEPWSPMMLPLNNDPGVVVDVSVDSFGYVAVDQNDIPRQPGNNGDNSCSPAALAMALAYLQSLFPGIYGESLIPGTATETAQELAELMGTNSETGTTARSYINSKHRYIESKVPGKTRYKAQSTEYEVITPGDTDPDTSHSWVEAVYPELDFLVDWLSLGAAVEIGIRESGGGSGHMVDVVGLHWEDMDPDGSGPGKANGMIDPGEATLRVIDPAMEGDEFEIELWHGVLPLGDTVLIVGYDGMEMQITTVVAQIPAPGSLAWMGVAMIFGYRYRRCRMMSRD